MRFYFVISSLRREIYKLKGAFNFVELLTIPIYVPYTIFLGTSSKFEIAIPLEISVSMYDESLERWLLHHNWHIYQTIAGDCYLRVLNQTGQTITVVGVLKYFFAQRNFI